MTLGLASDLLQTTGETMFYPEITSGRLGGARNVKDGGPSERLDKNTDQSLSVADLTRSHNSTLTAAASPAGELASQSAERLIVPVPNSEPPGAATSNVNAATDLGGTCAHWRTRWISTINGAPRGYRPRSS